MKKNNLTIVSLVVILITVLTKLIGFGRELVLAYYFSASEISDAYLLASDIVTIVFGWITTFSIVYTPIYTSIFIKEGKRKGLDYTNKIILIVSCMSFLAVIVTELAPELFVNIVASGLGIQEKKYVVSFLRVVIFSIGFNALAEIFVSYLNLNEEYTIASSVSIPFNVIEVVAIAVAGYYKIPIIMGTGIVCGNIVKMLLAYYVSTKKEFRFINKIVLNDIYLKETLVIFIPIYLNNMLVEINTLIDKSFASYLKVGSVTQLNYGAVTRRFIFNVFSVVISSIFFPNFSKIIAEDKKDKATAIFDKTVSLAIVIFIPITFLAVIFSQNIMKLLFGHGAFSNAISTVNSIFSAYCIGLTGMIVNELCSKVIYAFKNSKIPMIISVINIVCNLFFNIILIKKYDAPGLALATSVSQLVVMPVYLFIINRKFLIFSKKKIFKNLIQSFLSSCFLAIVLWDFNQNYIVGYIHSEHTILVTGVGSIFFIGLYFALMYIQKNEAILELITYKKTINSKKV